MTAVTVQSDKTTGSPAGKTKKDTSKTAQGVARASGSVLRNLWLFLGFRGVSPIWAWPRGGQGGLTRESASAYTKDWFQRCIGTVRTVCGSLGESRLPR